MDTPSNQEIQPVKLYHTTYCPPDTDCENRTPVIFVHGVGATSGTWKGVKGEISHLTKRKIICIDLRSHGKSEWPDVISLDHVIIDVENFMTEQNLPKAIFLGHSFGGRVVLGLAFRRPDLIERLILEDTFLHFTGVWQGVLEKMWGLANLIKKFPKTLTEDEAHNLIWKQCEVLFPDEAKSFRKKQSTVIPFYKEKKTGLFKCYFDLDVQSKLGNCELDLSNFPIYDGKCLVMTAEKSNYNEKSDVEELRKHLPNSQEVCIIGGTHALHIENPEQFIKEVTKFINED